MIKALLWDRGEFAITVGKGDRVAKQVSHRMADCLQCGWSSAVRRWNAIAAPYAYGPKDPGRQELPLHKLMVYVVVHPPQDRAENARVVAIEAVRRKALS
jgi:hypothetical protein